MACLCHIDLWCYTIWALDTISKRKRFQFSFHCSFCSICLFVRMFWSTFHRACMAVSAGCQLCIFLLCGLQQLSQMKQWEKTEHAERWRRGVWCKHRVSQDRAPGRSGSVKSAWEGRSDIESNVASCICHLSSSSSSSSTWTEPPSRSAVRCDPKVSLLVTGVGWDSLPLGSGDLTQRVKRVEAGGREVVRRRRGGERRLWGEGWGNVVGRVREGTRRRGSKLKKRNKNKKIIEDISQAEAGLLRQTMLIEE